MKKKTSPISTLFSLLLLLWTLFPIYWMVNVAFQEIQKGKSVSFVPTHFTLNHLQNLLLKDRFVDALKNSLSITLIGLAVSLSIGTFCAYILSIRRFQSSLKAPLLLWILLVRIIPPITFALPLYIQMNRYHLLHTKLPIVSAHVLLNLPLVIWVMMNFFKNVPQELQESSKVDGASEWQIFSKIMLPIVLPGITAISIFGFMMSWNEYLYGVIFVQNPNQFTVPLKLATLNSEQELLEWGKVASGGIISAIPVAIFMIGMQNFLLQGLTAGSVKE
ncbi:MAG: carbohydrate ABC transporter permease [Vallitaleaceae bacterium]|nr:carbohydrate ABC transporter permease [Vallitaleaceae bacterium]